LYYPRLFVPLQAKTLINFLSIPTIIRENKGMILFIKKHFQISRSACECGAYFF
jgi:hypothetical protein